MSHQNLRIYEFGPFRLDVTDRLLWRDGKTVPLQPKVFDLLVALVERHGRLVEKEELMEAVWPDTFVEESNIASNISTLRKALGEDGQQFIETAPKRGYRFVAPVIELTDGSGESDVVERHDTQPTVAARQGDLSGKPSPVPPKRRRIVLTSWWLPMLAALIIMGCGFWVARIATRLAATVVKTPRSIAVLPSKPLVTASRDMALELGLADTLINKLSSLKQITVKPMSAVRNYIALNQDSLEAGREQQVDTVLESSIHLSGEKLRVTWRLLDVRDGSAIVADSCNEYCADIFVAQDAIAREIVEALALALTGEEKNLLAKHDTENVEAYQAYNIGRFHAYKRTLEGIQESIGFFQRAIDLDARYSQAYAGLARSYCYLGWRGGLPPGDAYSKAKAAAAKALELDDMVAEAHDAQGMIKMAAEWNWTEAEREFKRTIQLNPSSINAHHQYSHLLDALGRSESSLAESKFLLKLDSLDLAMNAHLGWHYLIARQPDLAIATCRRTLDMGESYHAHWYMGQAFEQKGRYEEAVEQLNKAIAMSASGTEAKVTLGHIYAVSGQRAAARKVIDELVEASKQRYVSLGYLAIIYAGLGEKDQAFKSLEQAFKERPGWLVDLNVDPRFDTLRSDPRFADLVRRMNLAP